MSNVDNTVQWTLDKHGDLAILAQGKWYGFMVLKHPSEVTGNAFTLGFGGMFKPFQRNIEMVKYLDNQDLETFTFEGDY